MGEKKEHRQHETWNMEKECVNSNLKTNDVKLSQFPYPWLIWETDIK